MRANGSGTGILDGFRLVTAEAIRGRRFVAEQRLHARLGVAGGASYVIAESGIGPIGREAMTERAIRPESRAGINPRVGIHVFGVGKIRHNRSHVLKTGEGQQIVTAGWGET